jgi:hypothetical protein
LAGEEMSDRERIRGLLEQRGSLGVTTFELRQLGYSGNPSQRIRELKDAGYTIESEPFVRDDGRRGSKYVLMPKGSLF